MFPFQSCTHCGICHNPQSQWIRPNNAVIMAIITTALGLVVSPTESLELDVQTFNNGSYDVFVKGEKWLQNSATFLHMEKNLWTTDSNTLVLCEARSHTSGKDALGSWTMVGYAYRINTSKDCTMKVTIKSYTKGNIVIFSQMFPKELHHTSTGDMDAVVTSFPAFKTEGPGHLGLLAFNGLFNSRKLSAQRFNNKLTMAGGMESGPIILFNKLGPAIVMSSFSEFMASSMWHNSTGHSLNWGVMGKAASIPAQFATETIMFYSPLGINKAVNGWGETLSLWYKKDARRAYQDLTVTHLGYYTDNGAYYYNHLQPPFTNFEQMFLGITKEARKKNIPYRYLQYDDWWYFINGSGYGATVRWEARPEVFPNGLKYLHNITQLPVVAHNRFWSNITPYAKQNGGEFDFITYQGLSLPIEQAFWEWLFVRARKWGMVTYEQDWLNYQTERILQLHSNVRLGSSWLMQMGTAAFLHNVTIQYCMALPRHFLQAVQIPAVTQVRVSGDYHSTPNQWRVGVSSMLAVAVGLAPFKDNFWTQTSEPGNPYKKTERNPILEAVVAILTTGPVGPSDGYHMAHPRLIARLHRADGLLLKPGRPALAIDAQIHEMAFHDGSGPDGEVWTAQTTINGLMFGIILAVSLSSPYQIGPTLAGFPNMGNHMVVYPYSEAREPLVEMFSDTELLKLGHCKTSAPCLLYTSPVLKTKQQQVILLGELDKFVPISPQRISNINIMTDDINIAISGAPGEEVLFSMITASGPSTVTCSNLGPTGQAVISVTKGSCRVRYD